MAVALSAEDIGKLSPDARRQIDAQSPKRKPAPKPRAITERPAVKPVARRARYVTAARAGTRRYAKVGVQRAGRAAARSAPAANGRQIFGMITGAGLVGLLVLRGNTVGPLLGHMAAFWRDVIKLGTPVAAAAPAGGAAAPGRK